MRDRRLDAWLALGVALLARFAVVAWASGRFPAADDGHYYDVLARRLVTGTGYTWLWPDGAVTFVGHYPVGYPALGLDVDVVDAEGNPLRGEVGELVCRRPWPGMTRGVWGDDARYIETYWSRFPGIWTHGDWASIDAACWRLANCR